MANLDMRRFFKGNLLNYKSDLPFWIVFGLMLTSSNYLFGYKTASEKCTETHYKYENNTSFSKVSSGLSNNTNLDAVASCNGTPIGGLAKISNNIGCRGVSFKLKITALAYSFDFDGLSYQWQQSDDGITWNNLTGETNPISVDYTTTQTSYFRLSVLCSFSGETGYSSIVVFIAKDCEEYNLNAQNVVNTCGALFYDSGGINGNYSNNEDRTITFCSSSDEKMRVDFLKFNTQDNGLTGRNHIRNDILFVYDGPNISAPPLFEFAGVMSASSTVPLVISSGRCITFRFRSDSSIERMGWEAVVTCTTEENRTASQFCQTAPNICNLDEYFGTTSNFYNVERVNNQIPGGFFQSLALDNTSFITFVAEEPKVEVDIWIGECTPATCGGGFQGIQLGVIEGRNCVFSRVLANYGLGIPPGNQRLTFNGLTPGEVYYLFVDGWNCSNCKYKLNALSGIALAQIDVPTALICEEDKITITASGGTSYTWRDALGNIISNDRSVTVSGPGVFQVVVKGGNALCPDEIILTSTIFTKFCCPKIEEPVPLNPTIICLGEEIPELTVDSGDDGLLINWYDAITGGSLLLENSNNYMPMVSGQVGSYVYYVSNQLSQSDCFSDRIPVELLIKDYTEALFDTLDTYCIGNPLPQLPIVSLNDVSGLWSPSSFSIDQTEYVFTPFKNQCSFILNLNIESKVPIDPVFKEQDKFCVGATIASLPSVSENGISGIWTPDINNLLTTTYQFTPDQDICASKLETTIIILQNTGTTEITKACDRYEWKGQTYTQSGTYTYNTTSAAGCDSIVTLQLTINNSNFSTDSLFACDLFIIDGVEVKESGTYTYNSKNRAGCDSTSTILLEIIDGGIYIPNIFSGNANSVNNCFSVKTSNQSIQRFEINVYDRWGNLVFLSKSIDECWDGTFNGKICATGVYTYLINMSDPGCGVKKIVGDVTLIR